MKYLLVRYKSTVASRVHKVAAASHVNKLVVAYRGCKLPVASHGYRLLEVGYHEFKQRKEEVVHVAAVVTNVASREIVHR